MTTELTDTDHCSPAAEPLALSSSDGLGLVERLRDWADETYALQDSELPDVRRDLAAAATEIERLRAAINEALPFTVTEGQRVLTAAFAHNVGAKPTAEGGSA